MKSISKSEGDKLINHLRNILDDSDPNKEELLQKMQLSVDKIRTTKIYGKTVYEINGSYYVELLDDHNGAIFSLMLNQSTKTEIVNFAEKLYNRNVTTISFHGGGSYNWRTARYDHSMGDIDTGKFLKEFKRKTGTENDIINLMSCNPNNADLSSLDIDIIFSSENVYTYGRDLPTVLRTTTPQIDIFSEFSYYVDGKLLNLRDITQGGQHLDDISSLMVGVKLKDLDSTQLNFLKKLPSGPTEELKKELYELNYNDAMLQLAHIFQESSDYVRKHVDYSQWYSNPESAIDELSWLQFKKVAPEEFSPGPFRAAVEYMLEVLDSLFNVDYFKVLFGAVLITIAWAIYSYKKSKDYTYLVKSAVMLSKGVVKVGFNFRSNPLVIKELKKRIPRVKKLFNLTKTVKQIKNR